MSKHLQCNFHIIFLLLNCHYVYFSDNEIALFLSPISRKDLGKLHQQSYGLIFSIYYDIQGRRKVPESGDAQTLRAMQRGKGLGKFWLFFPKKQEVHVHPQFRRP